MTAFTLQLKDGRILNRQHRSALLVSSTSWTGETSQEIATTVSLILKLLYED